MKRTIALSETGDLFAFDFSKINFITKRIFFIKNVPIGTIRGNHANKFTNQILFCTSGEIHLIINLKAVIKLKTGDFYIHNRMNWIEMIFIEENSELCVLADKPYDKNEYITDYATFLKY